MFIVFGAFMVASWVARSWATSATSSAMQYAGLGLYVVAWAVFMLPMLYICVRVLGEPDLPIKAAAITAMCFMGLTAYVFMSRVDLAGWGKYLMFAGFAALGVILTGMLFGFSLGLWFSGLMVALMCGYILYDTSNILHHYHTNQHVAASLALFADVVMLFWYVLQIMMRFSGRD
jgi:FtsH-binding integral membrane protein